MMKVRLEALAMPTSSACGRSSRCSASAPADRSHAPTPTKAKSGAGTADGKALRRQPRGAFLLDWE